jgi:hypothetical protein
MAEVFNPYRKFLNNFQKLLTQCSSKKNPAWWLYKHEARTVFFMLEGIARIHYKTEKKRNLGSRYKTFKKLEDLLGDIDHFHELIVKYSSHRNIPEKVILWLEERKSKAILKLNNDLTKNDYYKRFFEIHQNAASLDFNNEDFLKNIAAQIISEYKECYDFFEQHKIAFSSMEEQVHELRRKLRWLHIYGKSMGGFLQLKNSGQVYQWEKAFIKARITKSTFNILPVRKGLKHYLLVDKKAFLASSYVVYELGEIKDKGLAIESLAELLEKFKASSSGNYRIEAQKLLKMRDSYENLLKQAHGLLRKFFKIDAIHENLFVAG